MPEDLGTWFGTIKQILRREIAIGGELKETPCPFCHLPRCQRSSYIRCQRCGINWSGSDDLSKHPHTKRGGLTP